MEGISAMSGGEIQNEMRKIHQYGGRSDADQGGGLGRQTSAARADRRAQITSEDRVRYWSKTHGKLLDATMLHRNDDGTYALDLKTRADASKIFLGWEADGAAKYHLNANAEWTPVKRRDASPHMDAMSDKDFEPPMGELEQRAHELAIKHQWVQRMDTPSAAAPAQQRQGISYYADLHQESDDAGAYYPKLNEHVEYYSGTYCKWVKATVLKIIRTEGGTFFDLDVKQKVAPEKLRQDRNGQGLVEEKARIEVADQMIWADQPQEQICIAQPDTPLITPRPVAVAPDAGRSKNIPAGALMRPDVTPNRNRGRFGEWGEERRSAERDSFTPIAEGIAMTPAAAAFSTPQSSQSAQFMTPMSGTSSYTPASASSASTPASSQRRGSFGPGPRAVDQRFQPAMSVVHESGLSNQSELSRQSSAQPVNLAGAVQQRTVASASKVQLNAQSLDQGTPLLNRDGSRLSVSSSNKSSMSNLPSTSASGAGSVNAPAGAAPTERLILQTPLRATLTLKQNNVDMCRHGQAIANALGLPAGLIPQMKSLGGGGAAGGVGGGQNNGLWTMDCGEAGIRQLGHQVMILKLVPGQRKIPMLPTEAENIMTVAKNHPQVREDTKLTFPIKVLDVETLSGTKQPQYTLFVMPRAKGERLADWMGLKISRNKVDPTVMEAMRLLGKSLKEHHEKHPKLNHADFTPSNIYYNEQTKEFTFIDLGGIGTMVTETDVQHFLKSLQIISSTYGQEFLSRCSKAFTEGYGPGANAAAPSLGGAHGGGAHGFQQMGGQMGFHPMQGMTPSHMQYGQHVQRFR